MMNTRYLCLFLLFSLLQGCAIGVISPEPEKLKVIEKPAKTYSITFRAYEKFVFKDSQEVELRRWEELERAIYSAIESSGIFHKIVNDRQSIQIATHKIDETLLPTKISTDIYVDISLNSYGKRKSLNLTPLYFGWGLLHGLSLGLLPVHLDKGWTLELQSMQLGSSEAVSQLTHQDYGIWRWSPFFFRKDAGTNEVLDKRLLDLYASQAVLQLREKLLRNQL